MRDIHGRYTALKEIIELGPEWAQGCEGCQRGIASSPPLTGACEIYLERLVQAIDRELVFCGCKAGRMLRDNLLHRRAFLKHEAAHHPLMVQYGRQGTHLDIEVARVAIAESRAKEVPTIHYEQTERVAA